MTAFIGNKLWDELKINFFPFKERRENTGLEKNNRTNKKGTKEQKIKKNTIPDSLISTKEKTKKTNQYRESMKKRRKPRESLQLGNNEEFAEHRTGLHLSSKRSKLPKLRP